MSEHSAAAFFDVWHTYRKVVAANYMHHMEIRAQLERVLLAQFASRPFSFLDLGCGDAATLAPLLASMAVQRYKGVDLSEFALALAAENLKALSCPVELACRDILAALAADSALYDVVYTSFALHHLSTEQKAEFFRRVAQRLEKDGLLLLTDIVREEDESLPVYLRRYCDWLRSDWSALDAEEKASACDHILNNDRPETFSVLRALAQAAGLGDAVAVARYGWHRVLCFRRRGEETLPDLAIDRARRASAAGSRRATSNERDNAVGLIAKRVRSRCLKICRRPRQVGVQDKEQIPGAELLGYLCH